MSYTRKVAYNTAAQMIGKVISTGIALATVAAIFRYFGVEGVGKYTTVFAFTAFFSVFADFGLQWTLIRELAITKNPTKVFDNIFALRLILALIIHALAFAAVWFFKYPLDVKLGVGVITAAWFFITINSVLVGVFLNNYRLDISVTAETICRTLIFLLVLVFVHLKLPFNMILAAYLVGNVFNFIINFIFVRRYVKVGLAFDFKYWQKVFWMALPIGITLVFGFIYYKIDSLMLSLMKGMVDVGIYGTAYKLLEVLQTVPSMFLGAAFPLVTKYVTTGDKRVLPAFQKQFDFLALLALPIVGGTFVLAEPIINFIAGSRGSEFINASTVSLFGHPITSVTCLQILIISVGINFITSLYSFMIVSLGRQKSMVWPVIGFAVLNVILNILFIPHFSYLGASVATLTTEIAAVSIYVLITGKFIRLPVAFKNFFKILLASSLMSAFVYFLNRWGLNLALNVLSAVIIYGLAVLLLKAIPLEMVKAVIYKGNENSH